MVANMARQAFCRLAVIALVVTAWTPVKIQAQDATAPAAPASPAAPSAAERAKEEAQRARERAEQLQAGRKELVEKNAKIDQVIRKLELEARDLDKLDDPKNPPTFRRPHGELKAFTEDDAMLVLNRMTSDFTGNKYLDTYIRSHLMWVVKKARQSDREEAGRKLVQLIKQMPGRIEVPRKTVTTYDPPEVYAEYRRKIDSLRVEVGYPPFQKYVNAPESFQHMDAARRAAGEKTYAEALALKDKFTSKVDKQAQAFNNRVDHVNQMVREYRGELIYELLKTGDPEMLKLVVAEMERQANAQTGIQFDLLNYMYMAAYDGVLNLYSATDLRVVSTGLEKIARAKEEYVSYMGQKRNFADYAFHMIYMLRDGGGFIDPKDLVEDPNARRRARSQRR